MDYFRVLGLEPKLALDRKDLEDRFHARSRELHPDRFARAPKPEQDRALAESALLNDAYRTLRSPVSRAEYLLKQSGVDSKDVPADLLEEMFELNMAKEEGEDITPRLEAMLGDADAQLPGLCAQWDAAPDDGVLLEIRALLNRRRYIENLIHGHV
jgi:molecular chaperone HscB